MLKGSYHNGFAPRDGIPLYPSLWRGCVGAWAPCLGPTGVTLRDWSAYKNHGTLTNMDPGTDFVLSGGPYSLDFDGTNDYVTVPDASQLNFTDWQLTVSCWANIRSVSLFPYLITKSGSNTTHHYGLAVNNSQHRFLVGGSEVNESYTPTSGVWVHYAGTCNGTTMSLYRNGALRATGTRTLTQTYSGALTFGTLFWNNNYVNGQIDDIRIYNRALNANEIAVLASRRGIAYDLAPMVMPYSEQVAGFNAAWVLRQRLILGGGGGMG